MMFYTFNQDQEKIDCSKCLQSYAKGGPVLLIGASPSLAELTAEQRTALQNLPVPKFAMNYGGFGKDGDGWLIKPNLWTAYDPVHRWSSVIYNDASITKLLPGRRASEVYDDEHAPVSEAPNTYFFDLAYSKFSDYYKSTEAVLNCNDSFLQALDLCYKLGFRSVYTLGCTMRVTPSQEQQEFAVQKGVNYNEMLVDGKHTDKFSVFVSHLAKAMSTNQKDVILTLQKLQREANYCISETKPVHLSEKTDSHYWRTIQYLRQSRMAMKLSGLSLYSLDSDSRLNTYFPNYTVDEFIEDMYMNVGEYESITTKGAYTHKLKETRPYQQQLPWHGKGRQPSVTRDSKPPKIIINSNIKGFLDECRK